MRIKLSIDQLKSLTQKLPFEVIIEQPRDVRGLLDLVGQEMPWDETGLSKFGETIKKPARLTFNVEAAGENVFVCDLHPALVQYIYTLLTSK
ncbi:MAG TPA: hypothetical protein DCX22_03170 [Dehalococcoidia bacterium]|nr:hypothetical protein [Dehalococcoidia bacterium]